MDGRCASRRWVATKRSSRCKGENPCNRAIAYGVGSSCVARTGESVSTRVGRRRSVRRCWARSSIGRPAVRNASANASMCGVFMLSVRRPPCRGRPRSVAAPRRAWAPTRSARTCHVTPCCCANLSAILRSGKQHQAARERSVQARKPDRMLLQFRRSD